jgi:hypothetical protein
VGVAVLLHDTDHSAGLADVEDEVRDPPTAFVRADELDSFGEGDAGAVGENRLLVGVAEPT